MYISPGLPAFHRNTFTKCRTTLVVACTVDREPDKSKLAGYLAMVTLKGKMYVIETYCRI